MSQQEPIVAMVDIIQTVLGLEDGQVMLAYQKFDIPTEGLFVLLNYVGPAKTICNVTEPDLTDPDNPMEVQSLTKQYLVQIEVMGYGDAARQNRERVELALNSFYSQRVQEENAMQIARIGAGWIDTSSLEGTEFLTRYTMTIAVTGSYQVQYALGDYYSDFTRAVPPRTAENA